MEHGRDAGWVAVVGIDLMLKQEWMHETTLQAENDRKSGLLRGARGDLRYHVLRQCPTLGGPVHVMRITHTTRLEGRVVSWGRLFSKALTGLKEAGKLSD